MNPNALPAVTDHYDSSIAGLPVRGTSMASEFPMVIGTSRAIPLMPVHHYPCVGYQVLPSTSFHVLQPNQGAELPMIERELREQQKCYELHEKT